MHRRLHLATYQQEEAWRQSKAARPQTVVPRIAPSFRRVARLNRSLGGETAFEWPKNCALWKEAEVIAMKRELELLDVVFDGCALGLEAHHGPNAGAPIRKPWRVATSMRTLREGLRDYVCPGPEAHPRHAPCQGSDTVLTGFYAQNGRCRARVLPGA